MARRDIAVQVEVAQPQAGTYKGKAYKDSTTLDLLAQKVIDQLRSEELPIWQAKGVLNEAIRLLDWETLK